MSTATNQYGSSGYPPGMSSTEEGENDDRSIASQMLVRKLHKQALQRLGIPEGRQKIDILQLNLLLDVKLALDAQHKRKIMETPRGIVETITLNLVDGNRLTHIDFEQEENTANVPTTNNVNEPQARLYEIHVYNDGPGEIAYSLNKSKSQLDADVGLLNGENKGFKFDIPTVKTLNIVATNGNAKVRIITLI